jgi:hypothetical protein
MARQWHGVRSSPRSGTLWATPGSSRAARVCPQGRSKRALAALGVPGLGSVCPSEEMTRSDPLSSDGRAGGVGQRPRGKPTVLQIMTAVPGALPITCVNAMTQTRGYALVPRISHARLFAPAPPQSSSWLRQIIAVPAAQSRGRPRRLRPDRLRPACALPPSGVSGSNASSATMLRRASAARAGSTSASLSAVSKRSSGSFSYMAVSAFSARSVPVSETDSLAGSRPGPAGERDEHPGAGGPLHRVVPAS